MSIGKQKKLEADHRDARYRFVLTELDLALTFCQLAWMAYDEDEAKSKRNTENAQRAYDAANHFIEDAGFSKARNISLQRKVSHLKGLLAELKRRALAKAH